MKTTSSDYIKEIKAEIKSINAAMKRGKAKQICPLWPKRIAPFGHNMIDPSGPNNIDHLARILPEIFLCRFKPPSPGVTGY